MHVATLNIPIVDTTLKSTKSCLCYNLIKLISRCKSQELIWNIYYKKLKIIEMQ